MAKSKKLFRKAQSDIFKLSGALSGDLRGDTRFTNSQLDAIFGNLRTTGKGLARNLTAAQRHELESMRRISQVGMGQAARQGVGAANAANDLYGGQYGGVVADKFGPALGGAKATKAVIGALGSSGNIIARGNQSALAIQRRSVASARSGADYATATALAERGNADASQVASAQLQLDQMRLSHELDLEKMKQDAKYNEAYLRMQQRLGQGGGAGGAGFSSAADLLQQMLLDPEVSGGTVQSTIQSLTAQYKLGPAAVQRLKDMASAYGGQEAGGPGSNPYAKKFGADMGMSPSAYLPAPMEKGINTLVWQAYKPGEPLTLAKAMSIAGITYGPDGKALGPDGAELAPEMVAAAVAYVFSTWERMSLSGVTPEQQGGGKK